MLHALPRGIHQHHLSATPDVQSVELLISLNVPNLPSMHWHDNAGWEVCIALDSVLLTLLRKVCKDARFLSVSLDEATAVDSRSYMAVHVYVLENWVRRPYFVDLIEVTEVPNAENLLATLLEVRSLGNGNV